MSDVAIAQAQPPALPASAPAPSNAPPPRPLDDPDDLAVAAAEAEVAAQAGGRQADAPLPAPARAPAAPAAPIMVPKERFDAARRRAKALEDENAYLKGALHARTQMGAQPAAAPAAAPAQAPRPTVDQLIAAQQQAIVQAATRFDEGQITMAQFEAARLQADNQIAVLRAQAILGVAKAAMPAPQAPSLGPADQQVMDHQLRQLEAQYPFSRALSNQELGFIADLCRQEAKALGNPIGDTHMDTMRLRQMVAEQSEYWARRWYPNRAFNIATPQATPAPQPAPAQQPQRNARAQQGAAKLALAASHPPNINQVGAASNSEGITLADIDRMTTEEIVALPDAVRARLLG